MQLTTGIQPLAVAVSHDPLGRAMTEEQKQRLREQADPPVAETLPQERLRERRRDAMPRRSPFEPDPHESSTETRDTATGEPGSIIDSYA